MKNNINVNELQKCLILINEYCSSLHSRIATLESENHEIKEQLDFIESESFINSVIKRIKDKQL